MIKKLILIFMSIFLCISTLTSTIAFGDSKIQILKFNASTKMNSGVNKEIENFTARKYNNGNELSNISIDSEIYLGQNNNWSIKGNVLGLEKDLSINATGYYGTQILSNGKEIYYGPLWNYENGVGIYIYYIPSLDKKVMTINITEDEQIANFTFGTSFKEIQEVLNIEESNISNGVSTEVNNEDNIGIKSSETMKIRAVDEVFLGGRRVGTLLMVGEDSGLGRDHENATHTISSKDNLQSVWESMYPNYIVQRPNVIEVETGILMPTSFSYRNHLPKTGATSFTLPVYVGFLGWQMITLTYSSVTANVTSTGGTYQNMVEWRFRKQNGFSDAEVDSAAGNSAGLVGYFVTSYRGNQVQNVEISGQSQITYSITRRDTASWNLVTDVYVTPRMIASYNFRTSI